MTVALLNALLILQTVISKDSVLVFRKIHLEKLLLNASLPLPAPHELLNNQKIDWIYRLTEQKTQQFTLTNNKMTNVTLTKKKEKD